MALAHTHTHTHTYTHIHAHISALAAGSRSNAEETAHVAPSSGGPSSSFQVPSCSVLQCVCSVLQCVAVRPFRFRCLVAVCCSVFAVCCSASFSFQVPSVVQCVCSVLQCCAVCCSVVQCAAEQRPVLVVSGAWCSALYLQCVAVLQFVAVWLSAQLSGCLSSSFQMQREVCCTVL